MRSKRSRWRGGFTLVELLIVIVVIAILAAISVAAYNGTQQRALNTSRLTEANAWIKLLKIYYTTNTVDPAPAGNYCLGSGFPSGACRDYLANNANTYYQANNTALMTQLSQVGSLPSGPRQGINGTVGPYVNIWGNASGFTVTDVFTGKSTDCPAPMKYTWDDGNGRLLCQVDVQYS